MYIHTYTPTNYLYPLTPGGVDKEARPIAVDSYMYMYVGV